MADKPHNRIYERFACEIPVSVWLGGRQVGPATIVNLGMGGALLRCSARLDGPGSYELRFAFAETRLVLAGRVTRAAGREPRREREPAYGFKFILSPRQEERLKLVIDKLRRDSPAAPGADMDWYWGL